MRGTFIGRPLKVIFQRQRLFGERYWLSHSRVNIKDRKGSETRSRDVIGTGDGGTKSTYGSALRLCLLYMKSILAVNGRLLVNELRLWIIGTWNSEDESGPSFAFFPVRGAFRRATPINYNRRLKLYCRRWFSQRTPQDCKCRTYGERKFQSSALRSKILPPRYPIKSENCLSLSRRPGAKNRYRADKKNTRKFRVYSAGYGECLSKSQFA